MEVLVNGDIYIKVKPEIVEPDINRIKKINDDIYDLSFEEAQYGITEKTETTREELERIKQQLLEQEYNYDNTEEFHILKITEDKFYLICFNKLGAKKAKICNIEEIKEKYIRIVDFLQEAKYIGKEFKRTKPLYLYNRKIIDYMHKEPSSTTKILYKTNYAMLAEYKSKHSHYFEMIRPKYFIDKKYAFIGTKDNKFDNKKEMYKTIVDEIENRYQYYKKYYKNK